MRMPRRTTIAELQDWERDGAVWRPVDVADDRTVIDLCSCSGELMERVEAEDPDVIAFVRAHQDG